MAEAPLERKKATEDMTRVLLEDVMKSFLMGNVMTIPKIRDSEDKEIFDIPTSGPDTAEAVEANFMFLLTIYATFSEIPPMSYFQATLYSIAQCHGFFAPRTRKKTVKEWARLRAGEARALAVHGLRLAARASSSRRKKIQALKRVIFQVHAEAGRDGLAALEGQIEKAGQDNLEQQEDGLMTGSSSSDLETKEVAAPAEKEKAKPERKTDQKLGNDSRQAPTMDTMETQAMEDSCFGTAGLSVVHPDMEQRRQAVKERQPLQPGVAPLEASLQEQANLLVEAAAKGAGADLVAAMAKVKAATREDEHEKAATKEKNKRTRRAQAERSEPKKKAKADGAVVDPPRPADGNEVASEALRGESGNSTDKAPGASSEAPPQVEAGDSTDQAPGASSEAPPQGEVEADGGAATGAAQDGPGDAQKKRRSRPAIPADQVRAAWKDKEAEFAKLEIPVPHGFDGSKKSYTLQGGEGRSSIGILWFTEQIYVYETVARISDFQVNKSGGTSVAIKKRGGWLPSWQAARVLAGWDSA